MSSGITKQVNMSRDFLTKALAEPFGALASLFFAAFGISLSTVWTVVERALTRTDNKMLAFLVTAGVQIRGNVAWVGRDFANIREVYPEFVIEGRAGIQDIFNFGAAHAAGHIIGHLSDNVWGQKMLSKAGSCITGAFPSTSEAGLINTEIAQSWAQPEREQFLARLSSRKTQYQAQVSKLFDDMMTGNLRFASKPGESQAPPPVPQPPSSSSKA